MRITISSIDSETQPLSIPHVKEIGSASNGLYIKLANPQMLDEVISLIEKSNQNTSVAEILSSDTIYLINVGRFFVKNK